MTFQVSREDVPTLPFVIPLYRKRHAHLTNMKSHNNPSIRSAAQAGLNKLSGYYEHALKSESCLIATGMFPFGHKVDCSLYIFAQQHSIQHSAWIGSSMPMMSERGLR
jgi:hypothetical protein